MSETKMKHRSAVIDEFGGKIGDRIDAFLLTGELKLRTAETQTLIAAVRVFPFAMVLLSEYLLTLMMAHPVILPSPVGMDIGTALGKAIRRIRLCISADF
jgi:hypothetical protein